MDSTDSSKTPDLKRTLSSSNINAANQIHDFIKVQQDACKDQIPTLNRDVTKSSMILPEQYNLQTLQLCVDLKCLHGLENEKYLNWCTDCRLLLPLQVEGDGNSLLHSLSLYMFGVHDRQLVLRQLLYQRLFMETSKGLLRSRWMVRNDTRTGITWNKVIEMASEKVQNGPQRYTQLTSIHIFTMANILARPIIVCCSNENNVSEVKDFSIGGIYLPLLRGTQECEKSPIILGYESGHFVPLISSENLNIPVCKSTPSADAYHCIPLVDVNFTSLHLKFLLPKEEMGDKPVGLRNSYMDVINISQRIGNEQKIIDAAMLKFKTPPAFSIELMWSLEQFALNSNRPVVVSNQTPASAMLGGRGNQLPVGASPQRPINAMHAGNEFHEPSYTNMQEINPDDNIYESLILCSQHGCPNNVSSNNNKDLCTDCYKMFLQENQRNVTKKRPNPVNPDIVPNHMGQTATGHLANVVGSPVPATMKCRRTSCPLKGESNLNGMCISCFKADEGRHTIVAGGYDPITTPRPMDMTDENNYDVGSEYDKLNNFDVQNTRTSDYDQLNNINVQNVRSNVVDEEGYLCPVPVTPGIGGPQHPSTSMVNNSQAINEATGLHKSNEAAAFHNSNEATAAYNPNDAGPKDSIRSKVLCNVAGCINSIGLDGVRCNVHNPNSTQQYNICVMKGCNNSAEYNDNFLCMVCFQSQKHVVREHTVLNSPAVSIRNEGSYDLKSIANELPPIPKPTLVSQSSPYPQPAIHKPSPSVFPQPVHPNQSQPRYPNMTNTANMNMFAQNMPEIPGIPSNIPKIPEIPNIPRSLPNTQGVGFTGGSNFTPPMAYGGFEGFSRNFASQNASLNWQKGGAATKEITTPQKCIHCDNHASPSKEGLCNECWRQKEQGTKQVTKQEEVILCINDDCDGEGSEKFNFLCELCYKKQLEAMNKQKKKDEVVVHALPPNTYVDVNVNKNNQMNYGNYDRNNQMDYGNTDKNNQMSYGMDYGNANKNNTNYGGDFNNPFFVNREFQQQQMQPGNFNYEPQQQQMHTGNINPVLQHQQQQMHSGNINPVSQHEQQQMHYGNTTYGMHQRQIHPGQVNQELQQPQMHPGTMVMSNIRHSGQPAHVAANTDQVYQVPTALVGEAKKTCKGLSCQFFGSEEYGGYCSGCFLNITKKESEKQEGIRTYAPSGVTTIAPRPNDNVAPAPNLTAPAPNQTAPAPNQTGPARCKGPYCQNYGSLQRMGYCSECFRNYGET